MKQTKQAAGKEKATPKRSHHKKPAPPPQTEAQFMLAQIAVVRAGLAGIVEQLDAMGPV